MPDKKSRVVEPGSADELARILMLWIRYTGAPHGALVHDLSDLGIAPARIAQLLGADGGSVRAQKSQNRPVWPRD
jgi:hypothetical protein